MRIKWLGHACFLITSANGIRIITDPYTVGGGIKYAPVTETADVVTVSHEHGDHCNVSAVKGKPDVLRGSGTRMAAGIEFRGIATHHDAARGQQRGPNTVFCFTVDGMSLCHLGDLGHALDAGQVSEIGPTDVLFIPVGGFYTIDASVASQTVEQLRPRVVIPMHFRTPRCDYPIADVQDFIAGKKNVRTTETSEVEFEARSLASPTQIVLLRPAL
jgi:L-ascorbate metabolism protein UlaG (beta-lactamase superfamily)